MKAAVVDCLHTGMGRESGDISGEQRVSWTMSQQHVPVYGRGGVRASIIADPEASPVQLHGNVIVVPFIQQHSAVFISGNLRPQREHLDQIFHRMRGRRPLRQFFYLETDVCLWRQETGRKL